MAERYLVDCCPSSPRHAARPIPRLSSRDWHDFPKAILFFTQSGPVSSTDICRSSRALVTAMAYNATLSPLPPHSLYADIDVGGLNWFEKQWMAWYIWIDNPVIATGLMSFLMHEVSLPLFLAIHSARSDWVPRRLFILVVASHGSSLTRFHTFGNGSCNRKRFHHLSNNGSAPKLFYFLISWWSFQS
jgi:hypothetical protein